MIVHASKIIRETDQAVLLETSDFSAYTNQVWVPKACIKSVMWRQRIREGKGIMISNSFAADKVRELNSKADWANA